MADFRKHIAIAAGICLVSTAVYADKVLTGVGEFYAESYHSLNDCREGAMQNARVKALESEYGRTVSEQTISVEQTSGKGENSFFEALGTTEVRGEWIADVAEPKFDVSLSPEGLYVVRCTVQGSTRAVSNEAVDFKAIVLRNGDDRKCADTSFKSGDTMKVLFQSPVDGYVAAYLACPDGNVYTLLPSQNNLSGNVRVKGGKEYVLFSQNCRDLNDNDQLTLVTQDPVERNILYVMFSPNEFVKAVDSAGSGMVPRSLNFKDFNKWLQKTRSHDPKMNAVTMHLTINGQ